MGKIHNDAGAGKGKAGAGQTGAGGQGTGPGDDMILTPGGWKHKSKVHRIEAGYHVSGAGGRLRKIHTATGKVMEDFGEVAKPGTGKDLVRGKRPTARRKGGPDPGPETDGWVVYANWSNTTGKPISSFTTTWEVPPAPTSADGQIVYLFNGLQQTSDGPYILQPVLQWGYNSEEMDGGNYWVINNWYVSSDSAVVGSSFVTVTPGTVLTGIMTLTGQSAGEFSYKSSFVGYPQCDLNVSDIDELTWAAETLECYNFTEFSDYPATALTALHNIEIKVQTSSGDVDASFTWTPNNVFTDNGQQCLIVSNDNPGGDVYLYYETVQPSLYFITDKNTFSKDEVTDVIATNGGKFQNAFWVALEGFTLDQLSIDQTIPLAPTLSGAFSTLSGVQSIAPDPSGVIVETNDPYVVQRIRFPYDITFSSTTSFPSTGSAELYEILNAAITIEGNALQAGTYFELDAGADPYFTNVDASNSQAVFYLSQDLRVFSAAPGDTPYPGAPAFTGDPYGSIQSLIQYLNGNQSTPTNGADPLNNLPGQTGYETGLSSTTYKNGSGTLTSNYAIARVRLQDLGGSSADNVRVFFRFFVGQSFDTDFQPLTTYKSTVGSPGSGADAGNPIFPLPSGTGLMDPSGNSLQTIPFFATNATGSGDYDGSNANANIRTITIPMASNSTWAYFGCFLDVYNTTVQAILAGTHHCLVAQIACDDSPLVNPNGFTWSPENTTKLAQRNLQITPSGNPSFPLTHQIPQAFDTRPSLPVSTQTGDLLDYPDEMMIDWGNVPVGSIANIYWPQVSASDVLSLASKLYSTHQLSAADSNTIVCAVTKDATYVPIPSATGKNFAGLFTISLPTGIHIGQEFNAKVRRISSRRYVAPPVIPGPRVGGATLASGKGTVAETGAAGAGNATTITNWRYVTGTFQVQIPVGSDRALLPAEENTLAVLKWRLQQLSPANRWYPVLERYVAYVTGRVNGFGGNAASVPPSIQGYTPGGIVSSKKCCVDTIEYTGRVVEVIYNCLGLFEGFILETCCERQRIRSAEEGIEKIVLLACSKALFLTVSVDKEGQHKVCNLLIRSRMPA